MTEKKYYIDCLRCLSALAVVMIHICVTAKTDFSGYSAIDNWLATSTANFFHFSVPCFLMISGVLFLDPAKTLTISKLIKRYISRYVLVVIIFGWGFSICEEVFRTKKLGIMELGQGFIAMLEGRSWEHMWYMYTLIGVMLIVPVLKVLIDRGESEVLMYILIVILLFHSLLPCIKSFMGVEIGVVSPFSSIYIAYIILGFMIGTGKLVYSNRVCRYGIVMACVVIMASYYGVIFGGIKQLSAIGSYDSPVVVLLSSGIFIYMKNHEKNIAEYFQLHCWLKALILMGSSLSFGVYLIHMFWINLAYKLLCINPFGSFMTAKIIGLWFGVLGLSFAAAWLMGRMPLLKKIL